jgi:hypothetical protein
MSDYLWDKTGEPEEDVERLENLLGGLRFQPRTFEVPTTLPFAPRRAIAPARHTFSWSRLAIAASLLLMLLAGAWLIATKQRTNDTQQVAGAKQTGVDSTPQKQLPQPPQQKKDQLASNSSNNDETTTKHQEQRESIEQASASNPPRRQRRDFISVVNVKRNGTLPRHSNVSDVNATREGIAKSLTPQEKLAMEQFMLAMRVTSEKLGYAERQVATLNAPQR